ncbi:WD40-repeat-containing domain protein [Xylogone sp. PMI_703]|nr:WD40-repeat-containing domain protein [Xylogone sp. PMI_703]
MHRPFFSHDLTRLASKYDDVVEVWDLHDGKCLQTFKIPMRSSVIPLYNFTHLAFRYENKIGVYDIETRQLQEFGGHNMYVNSIIFSHDSALLASASKDKTIKVWDTSSG